MQKTVDPVTMLYVSPSLHSLFPLSLPSAFSLNITHTFSKSVSLVLVFSGHLYFTTPSLHAILFHVPSELSIVSDVLSSSDGNYIMMNNGLLWTNIPQWHKHTHIQTESLWELVVFVHIWLIFKEVWLLISYSPV